MFGEILRQLREDKKLSQAELALELNVSQPTVGSWETSRTEPDMENQIKLADYFGVTIDYLLGREVDKEYIELYKRVFNNPDLKIFFDKTSDLTKEELRWIIAIVEKVKEEHYKNKN